MNLTTTVVPETWNDEKDHRNKIARTVNRLLSGKGNNFGSVTLTASSATTVLTDKRIGINSVILLMPLTANAATETGNGTLYFNSPGNGTVTINNANNSQTDRTFNYVIIG